MQQQYTITADEKDIELIDEASEKDKRSRSSFLIISALERAKKLDDKR